MTGRYPIILLQLVVILFCTCKKGEDDPMLSLMSRKARITGNWHLTAGKALYNDPVRNIIYSFDKSSYSANVRLGSKVTYNTGNYGILINIGRNGEFKLKETYGSRTLDVRGAWNFNSGVAKQKAKAEALFSIEKINEGYISDYLFNRGSSNFIYTIKELRNKKLVISSSGRLSSDTKGNYATFTTEYTFEQ